MSEPLPGGGGPSEPRHPQVRRIRPDEGALLRSLRVRALAEEPEAFGETAAAAGSRDAAEYTSRARAASTGDRRAWFLAELPGTSEPVGLAMGRRRPPHDCMLFSVWVARSVRRAGVGRALVAAVADWARGWDARTVVLWVFRSNRDAIRFYERLGFVIEASGPDAVLGAPHGAVAMHLQLGSWCPLLGDEHRTRHEREGEHDDDDDEEDADGPTLRVHR